MNRITIRKTIQRAGKELFNSLSSFPEFQYIVGELMAGNEEYVLHNQDEKETIKTQEIIESGFSLNQRRFIGRLRDRLQETPKCILGLKGDIPHILNRRWEYRVDSGGIMAQTKRFRTKEDFRKWLRKKGYRKDTAPHTGVYTKGGSRVGSAYEKRKGVEVDIYWGEVMRYEVS